MTWGPPSPPLLAALDRADLIGALRDAPGLAGSLRSHDHSPHGSSHPKSRSQPLNVVDRRLAGIGDEWPHLGVYDPRP